VISYKDFKIGTINQLQKLIKEYQEKLHNLEDLEKRYDESYECKEDIMKRLLLDKVNKMEFLKTKEEVIADCIIRLEEKGSMNILSLFGEHHVENYGQIKIKEALHQHYKQTNKKPGDVVNNSLLPMMHMFIRNNIYIERGKNKKPIKAKTDKWTRKNLSHIMKLMKKYACSKSISFFMSLKPMDRMYIGFINSKLGCERIFVPVYHLSLAWMNLLFHRDKTDLKSIHQHGISEFIIRKKKNKHIKFIDNERILGYELSFFYSRFKFDQDLYDVQKERDYDFEFSYLIEMHEDRLYTQESAINSYFLKKKGKAISKKDIENAKKEVEDIETLIGGKDLKILYNSWTEYYNGKLNMLK
jgi:hypothetical protein